MSNVSTHINRNLKDRHEIAVANSLLRARGVQAKFLRHGNDSGEPDVLYEYQQKVLGIEVATAYYDDWQAKAEWRMARGEVKLPPRTPVIFWRGSDFDENICQRIQQEINDKCFQRYVGMDIAWLCIERHAPLSDHESAVACASRLTVQSRGPFDEIFIHYYDAAAGLDRAIPLVGAQV